MDFSVNIWIPLALIVGAVIGRWVSLKDAVEREQFFFLGAFYDVKFGGIEDVVEVESDGEYADEG